MKNDEINLLNIIIFNIEFFKFLSFHYKNKTPLFLQNQKLKKCEISTEKRIKMVIIAINIYI